MKYRYFIELSFNGHNYHGWQIQPNAVTVQSVLTKCISLYLNEDIELTGAGRTDAGVHASFFVVHFDSVKSNVAEMNFIFRLNRFLPKDIALKKIYSVNSQNHSRFDAISRTYKYFINHDKDPFMQGFSYYFSVNLNIDLMNEAANQLFNYTDFTSFSKLHTERKTNNCKIYHAKWTEEQNNNSPVLVFTIKADRFLRNMVRAIVGTLLDVGKGKTSIADFKKIIENKDRSIAGTSAKSQGLFLTDIEY